MRALRFKRVFFLPALLALAGCGGFASDDTVATPVVDPAFSATRLETPGVPVNNTPIDTAFVRLPAGAGRILAVRERRYVNGASQQIVLDGERVKGIDNRVDISVQTQAEGGRQDLYVPMAPPNEAGVKAELQDRFPGVTMVVSQKPVANSYGPYGLAIGRDGATRCVYAWQWIDDLNAIRPGKVSLLQRLSLVGGSNAAPASIRVRLCRRDVSLDQLAGYVTQMVIGNMQTLNRLLAQGGAAASGSADQRVGFAAPTPTSLEAELSGDAAPRSAVAAAPARTRTAAHRAPRKSRAAEAPEPQPTYAPPPVAGQYGPRYLVPPSGGAPNGARPAQGAASPYSRPSVSPYGAASSAAAPASGLDPSLPPQAYQGPRSRPGQGVYR